MKLTSLVLFTLLLASCQPKEKPIIQKEWVYVEVKYVGNTGEGDYYRYGKVKSSIVPKIMSNSKTTGLFVIEEMRFINLQDKIDIWEDDESSGSAVFRVENIITLERLKEDPILTSDTSVLTLRSQEFKKNSKH